MTFNLPPKVRAALYVLLTIGSPIAIYLLNTQRIGDPEMSLWLALSAAIGLLARVNVSDKM